VKDEIDEASHLRLVERLREIVLKIGDVLDAGGDPDEAICDPELVTVRFGHRRGVIVAGCEMSVSTPPRLSASDIRRTDLRTRFAASSDPVSNASIPPKPLICRHASSYCGCEGRPG
jgi:hypothetical protein